MKRILLAWLLIFIGIIIILAGPAEAKHERWLPGIPSTVMKRAIDRGYVTYRLDEGAANYPGFRAQAASVALAGFNGVGIEAIEIVDGQPDIWLTMPVDQTFLAACKAGAAGCIYYWADPVMIYFRRALLYVDWKSTIGHEGLNYGHAMGQHEQYFDNGEFRCDLTAFYTVMSCGTGVWQPQQFDKDTVWAFTLPQKLSSYYGFSYTDQGVLGYWCGGDTLRARRIAIMAIAPDGTPYWSGIHRPVTTGCDSIPIIGEPGWCYMASTENGFNWKRADLRIDVLLGCL